MIKNQVHVLCSFKESSAVSQERLFKIRGRGKKKKKEKEKGQRASIRFPETKIFK